MRLTSGSVESTGSVESAGSAGSAGSITIHPLTAVRMVAQSGWLYRMGLDQMNVFKKDLV